ncbi:hypothetical protein [Paraburkholderia graminis]|uniref:hypothetical protein n=1 Tax=Paraburkholderia graminis TaxID=60548 RepID=UPI0038B74ECA
MTTTNHTPPIGEDAANGAIGEREAWDGDSKESRTAFRAYDSIAEPVSRKTSWQIWRDACAWQASRAALTAEKVAAEPTSIPFSAYRLKVAEECCERLMSACTDSGCPDGVNMADWIRQLAASRQATATLSDAALRKLVIGVREFILGYLHSHVKDWPAPYDHLRSDAVTESLVTDARDQIATATQPAQAVYRSAILEEAAKVCDAREDWYLKDDCRAQACAAAGCANDIRALLSAAQPVSGGKS